MQTLGEFLKEYEAKNASSDLSDDPYPVKVTYWEAPEQWFDIVCQPRDNYALGYYANGEHQIYTLGALRAWRLWTPPKKSRKEKVRVWLCFPSMCLGSFPVYMMDDQQPKGYEGSMRRCRTLDFEMEIEERE